ncbi:MAG: NAD-dependent epimerase/dehydratase family protein [Rhodoferax sp.]
MSRRIAITGANGFVGRALCAQAQAQGWRVRAITRRPVDGLAANEYCVLPDYVQASPEALWRALDGQDVLVHLAAVVAHQPSTPPTPPGAMHANRRMTEALWEAACRCGVGRFVHISSCGVHGRQTPPGEPFNEGSAIRLHDAYTRSKWEAEQVLVQQLQSAAPGVVVVRPPLVYGARAPGSFGSMLRWARRGWPLPFGAALQPRDLIAVDNLVSALLACAEHPAAPGQVFLVSDGTPLSVAEMLTLLAHAMGREPRLLALAPETMRRVGAMLGLSMEIERLFAPMQVDSRHIRRTLAWTPPLEASLAMQAAGRDYLAWCAAGRERHP